MSVAIDAVAILAIQVGSDVPEAVPETDDFSVVIPLVEALDPLEALDTTAAVTKAGATGPTKASMMPMPELNISVPASNTPLWPNVPFD
jgi:hypothetical protein